MKPYGTQGRFRVLNLISDIMIKYLGLFVALLTASFAQAQIKDLLEKAKKNTKSLTSINLSSEEVAQGLKEALNNGVDEAVKTLSADNGYLQSSYKILIPEEARTIIDKVKMVPGFQDVENKLIQQMNEAASLAARKAGPIFLNAVSQMSFGDAHQILTGPDNAATSYLEKTSREELYTTFLPVIRESLDQVNARTYWSSVVQAYNKIPFVKKMNPELDDHVNQKSLDGLFSLIAIKEKGIRTDINQQTSDLLKRVFGK